MDARDEKLPNEDLLEKLSKLMRRESTKHKRASFHEGVALSDDEQRDAEHDRQRRTSGHKEVPRMEERRPSIDRHGRRSSIDKKIARIPIEMRSRKVSIDLRALDDAAKQESQSDTQRDARERPSPTQADRSPDKDVDQRATDHSASHRNSLKSHSQETLLGKGGSLTDITVVRSLSQLSAHIRRLEAEEAPKQTRATASFDVRRPSGEGYRGAPPEALAAGRGPQTPRPAARGPLQRRLTPPVVLLTGQEGTFEAVFPQVVKDRTRPDSPDGSSRVCRGLRFSPAAIVFKNVFKGERRALRFVLQNVSERPICISVLDSSSVFRFDPQQCLVDEYGQLAKKSQDFQIFVRVLRVACIDYGIERGAMELFMASEAAQLRQREENAARDSFVRVCLHGRAAPLALRLTPRALQLGRVALGAAERRVLRLANGCARLPLLFRVARPPPPGVRVRPTHGALKPGGAVELLVQVAPVAFGEHARFRRAVC
ncbi:Low-density lipoprotein receptor [Gryllus bimaculatus]|nr:Low-density lipoprotein receptor [Gryllus bimaculatus]